MISDDKIWIVTVIQKKFEKTYPPNIGNTTKSCSNKLTLVWNLAKNWSGCSDSCDQNIVSNSWICVFPQIFLSRQWWNEALFLIEKKKTKHTRKVQT